MNVWGGIALGVLLSFLAATAALIGWDIYSERARELAQTERARRKFGN